MAWERPVLDLPGILAGEDFSANGGLLGYQGTGQFLFVKITSNMTVKHCVSGKDRMIGVSQGNSPSGDALQVRAIGVTKVVAGAAFNAGEAIGTDTNGRAVKKSETATGANYGDFVAGEALEGVLAAGSLGTVYLGGSPYRI